MAVFRRWTSTFMMVATMGGELWMNWSRSYLLMTTTLQSSRAMAVAVRCWLSSKSAISPKMEMGFSTAKTFLRPETMPEISTRPWVST